MKLNRLTLLSEYKNIPSGGTLDFSNQNYTSLVGANGSGKSNWIEAMAAVLLHLIEKQDPGFDYSLYLDEITEVRWSGGVQTIKVDSVEVDEHDVDLPKKLIVCYSGEDLRLWDEILMNSYARYFRNKEIYVVEEPPAIYINRYQWAIAFIILMCSQKQEVIDFVNELWGQRIPLSEIKVEVTIDPSSTGYKDPDTKKLLEQIRSENPLYMSHIASFDIGVDHANNADFCRQLYNLLYALSMPVTNGKRGIQLQKAITGINIEASNGLKLSGLSEGHKKRILIMLMTQVLGDENTVCLFDEPDAHVDVASKSKIIDLIEKSPGHVLLTTHSPLMTMNMKPEVVMTVTNGDTNKAEWKIAIENLSNHQFASVDNFLITLKRKAVITEGKYDVYYLREAINKLKDSHPELGKLSDMAFFSIGGTGDTEFFLNNSLKPVMSFLEKVLILFDKDSAGDSGYNVTRQFIRKNGYAAKIEVLKYAQSYPDPDPDNDFFVEDYFPAVSYVGQPNIGSFNIQGQPTYYEMKKLAHQSDAIKKHLEVSYKKIDAAYYTDFLPLLHQIISKMGV